VIKRAEYDGPVGELLDALADSTGCDFLGLETPLSEKGPDLGSRSFHRLFPPRIALFAGPPFYQSSFGSLWHLFDRDMAYPTSILKLSQLENLDLSSYNLLIFPDAAPGRGETAQNIAGVEGLEKVRAWMEDGGTLITTGESAWLLMSGDPPSTGLRARRQALDQLGTYSQRGRPNGRDSLAMNAREDEWLRRFSPQGAILRANLDADHWIAAGVGSRVPVMMRSDLVLLAGDPGQALGRFAGKDALKLSGLLWPEAAERISGSCYLYREAMGRGQWIAFQGNPAYRDAFEGSERLLINAVFLGPGMGALEARPW